MKDPETATVFAGVDARTKTDLPEWYRALQDVEAVTTFAEAIRRLLRAIETKVGYESPYTGEWVSHLIARSSMANSEYPRSRGVRTIGID